MTISVKMDRNYGGYPMRDYKIEVSGGGLISVKFKNNKTNVQPGGAFRLPPNVASQLARALLLASDSTLASPIVLTIDEANA